MKHFSLHPHPHPLFCLKMLYSGYNDIKQEANGLHHSPEKQFQSIKTSVQTYALPYHWKEKNILISFRRIVMALYLQKLESLHPNMLYAEFSCNPSGFERISLIFSRHLTVISLWKREWPFIWTNKLESPSPKDALFQVWLNMGKMVLEKNIL